MNLSGCKPIRIGLVIHGWLFENIHVVNLETLAIIANEPLKLNNPINICLIKLNY